MQTILNQRELHHDAFAAASQKKEKKEKRK